MGLFERLSSIPGAQVEAIDLLASPAASRALSIAAANAPPHRFERARVRRRVRLTAKVRQGVCDAIANGSWDWVAAAAFGIPKKDFRALVKRFPVFAREVEAAGAQSRVRQETTIAKTDPVRWARYGPGRERPDAPGWGASTTVETTNHTTVDHRVSVDLARLTTEELREYVRLTAKLKDDAPQLPAHKVEVVSEVIEGEFHDA